MQQASSLLLEKTLKAPSGGLLLGLCDLGGDLGVVSRVPPALLFLLEPGTASENMISLGQEK